MSHASASSIPSLVERHRDHGRYFQGEYSPAGLERILFYRALLSSLTVVNEKQYSSKSLLRYLVIADSCKDLLKEGTILDVGSRDDSAQQVFGSACQLIDKNNPRLAMWDWETEALPYPENSFDHVLCLDTLEHVEHFHRSLLDLVRVARKYVVISLPNPWRKMFKQMLLGYGTTSSYGLPFEKPLDRHRWFFNTDDAEELMFYQSANPSFPFKVKKIIHHVPIAIPRHRWQYALARTLLPSRYAKNLLVNTMFFVLEKQ